MRKDESVANFTQVHIFGGGCATDTAVTEMVRSSGGDNASSPCEDIRLVGRSRRGQNGKSRYRMFPKGTNVEVWI